MKLRDIWHLDIIKYKVGNQIILPQIQIYHWPLKNEDVWQPRGA